MSDLIETVAATQRSLSPLQRQKEGERKMVRAALEIRDVLEPGWQPPSDAEIKRLGDEQEARGERVYCWAQGQLTAMVPAEFAEAEWACVAGKASDADVDGYFDYMEASERWGRSLGRLRVASLSSGLGRG